MLMCGSEHRIVQVRRHDIQGPSPWLMFDYVEGGNLADQVHRIAGLSQFERVTEATSVLIKVCDAVAFFHTLPTPIVHRDLKPANILYKQSRNEYRVVDFGIGALTANETLRRESHGGMTQAACSLASLRGSHTPLYASSQQRNGHPASLQDDVHALGVIAYQLYTGRLDADVRTDYSRELRKLSVPEHIVALIGECCADNLAYRPKHAGELLARLKGAITEKAAPVPREVLHKRPPFTESRNISLTKEVNTRPPLPPASPAASTPAKLDQWIHLPGIVFCRLANQPDAKWIRLCDTPNTISYSPAWVYSLELNHSAKDYDLANLGCCLDSLPLYGLSLAQCINVTDAGIRYVVSYLPTLYALSLCYTSVTEAAVIEMISKMHMLNTLMLRGINISQMGHLEISLNCNNCDIIT